MAYGLFSGLLYRIAMKLTPTERAPKEAKKPDGRKLAGEIVLRAEVIARWRGEYEAGGIGISGMALKYGIPYGRMYRLLTYRDRADIDPIPPAKAA